jgi:hypothetical protein
MGREQGQGLGVARLEEVGMHLTWGIDRESSREDDVMVVDNLGEELGSSKDRPVQQRYRTRKS